MSQLGLDFGLDDSGLLHDVNQTFCKEVSCINWWCNCSHGNFLKNHTQDLPVEHTRDQDVLNCFLILKDQT